MRPELDVFHAALEEPTDLRERFLQDRYADDPDLIARVLRLLEAHARAEREELEGAGIPAALPGAREGAALGELPARVGPYRVLERIGAGGMGVVYAAVQERPLRRRVAVKVVKLGMDTEEVLLRFEAERQAMALMDHPGVAKVFDAGATEEGRPYFVMELVEGVSLTRFCREAELPLDERLRLFSQVCAAVRHAHQRGIIHRDLKPSNILVTVQDGQPGPKVIDFGIAKAMATPLTDRSVHTQHGRLIGTLEYMSPEQAGVAGHDVDVRTDVFALGVILYELITGELPIDSEVLRSGSFAEFLRQLREVDPPRPSTRIGHSDSERERFGPLSPSQVRSIRGDLDWIVMRAIDKDRSRRYASANALREDVERYLSNRPIAARPPKPSYVVAKFIGRHRIVTALIGLAAVSAMVGVLGLSVGLVRANRAEALAVQRADNAQAGAEFLERVLFQADPEHGSGARTVLAVLGDAEPWIEEELGAFPEVEASVRESIGVAFRRKSMFPEAAPHLERSLALRGQVLGEDHLETAAACIALAGLRFEYQGDVEQSIELLGRAAETYAGLGLAGSAADGWLQLDVGLVHAAGDRLGAAEAAFKTCRAGLTRALGPGHPDLSRPLRGLAQVALGRGELERAEQLAREAVALCERGEANYLRARAELVLAEVLIERGRLDPAAELVAGLDEGFASTVGARHIRVAERLALHSRLQLRSGEFGEALRSAEACEALRAELLHDGHGSIFEARTLRARALLGVGEFQQAGELLRALDGDSEPLLRDDHPLRLDALSARLGLAEAVGDNALRAACASELERLRGMRARRIE